MVERNETVVQNRKKMKHKISHMALKEERAAWFFLAPALGLLLLFVFIPMINAIWISLHSWDLLNEMEWAGIDNYLSLVKDEDWFQTLGRTFLYSACYVPALYVMSLLLALLVKHITKGTGIYRTGYFMPIILSSVVTGIIWKMMLNDRSGMINNLLDILFDIRIPWLSSTDWAIKAVLIVNVWQQMGYYMVVFLAGLQDIPFSYYEAAKIDGANGWQIFWRITLPNLKNTSLFVIVMTLIGSFQAYDQIAMLTDGGPAGSTTLSVQYIYETAFSNYNMGYAAALALNLFVIILVFSLLQFKLVREEKN